MLHVYDVTLKVVLNYRPATMVVFVVVLVATVYMFLKIPKGFIPDQDTDQIVAVTEASQGTSFDQMVQYQRSIAEVFRTNENVEAFMSTVGGSLVGDPGRSQFRPAPGAPQAARGAETTGRRSSTTCGRSCRAFPGCRSTCRIRPPSASAAR